MTVNNLPIYLVSLESDLERREQFEEFFPVYYEKIVHIKAVDGRNLTAKEYYEKMIPYFMVTGKTMSPSELGCALSHIETLEQFCESGAPYALILEDDIIGDDATIEKISSIAGKLADNAVLICGGQTGLNSRNLFFGKPELNLGAYCLARISHDYVYGTCCYVVTQVSAKIILQENYQNILLADNWGRYFIGKEIDIYFSDLLKHPIDLTNSHIEKDRALLLQTDVSKKNLMLGVFGRAVRQVKNETLVLMLRILGYKKVRSSSHSQ